MKETLKAQLIKAGLGSAFVEDLKKRGIAPANLNPNDCGYQFGITTVFDEDDYQLYFLLVEVNNRLIGKYAGAFVMPHVILDKKQKKRLKRILIKNQDLVLKQIGLERLRFGCHFRDGIMDLD